MQGESSILWRQGTGVCLLVFVAAVLVRMPNFNESLWYDEVWYTSVCLNGTTLNRLLFHDVHPPLYPLLMKAWIEVFGDGEISVRMPSLLFGLASLGVIFALAQAWFDRRTALLATVLMVFSPVHIGYSQEAKNNMLLLLLTLLAVYGVWRAWVYDTWKDWLLFLSSAILALWTNHFSLWVVMAAFLWLWVTFLSNRRHRALTWIFISPVAVALAYLPVIWLMLRQARGSEMGYLRPFTIAEWYKLLVVYLSHGNTLRTVSPYEPLRAMLGQHWSFFLVDAFFALLLGMGLFAALRHRLKHRKESVRPPIAGNAGIDLLLFYFFIPPAALLAASCFYPQIYIERSMIILLPPFFILLAHGVMALSRSWSRRAVVCLLFFVNILSLVNYWVLKQDAWTVYKPNPDWRAFAYDVRKDATGTVIFTSCPPLAMRYYLKDSAVFLVPMLTGDDVSKHAGREYIRRALTRRGIGYPRFFYVAINRYWGARRARRLNNEVISKMYPLIEKKEYFALEVYKYGLPR